MINLTTKQKEFFSKNEITAINVFNKPFKDSNCSIFDKITELKKNSCNTKLYHKLRLIYKNVSPLYADKYLVGYLENKNIKFTEICNKLN
jgi:hypothetical protein